MPLTRLAGSLRVVLDASRATVEPFHHGRRALSPPAVSVFADTHAPLGNIVLLADEQSVLGELVTRELPVQLDCRDITSSDRCYERKLSLL